MRVYYKYSLKWDIIWAYRTLLNYRWLKNKGLKFFLPNPIRAIKIILSKPKGPEIDTDLDHPVTCYWITSGTWGSYTPPDKIFICPYKIPNLKRVIEHEVIHLKYFHDTDLMSHEDKEDFVNRKQRKITNNT